MLTDERRKEEVFVCPYCEHPTLCNQLVSLKAENERLTKELAHVDRWAKEDKVCFYDEFSSAKERAEKAEAELVAFEKRHFFGEIALNIGGDMFVYGSNAAIDECMSRFSELAALKARIKGGVEVSIKGSFPDGRPVLHYKDTPVSLWIDRDKLAPLRPGERRRARVVLDEEE